MKHEAQLHNLIASAITTNAPILAKRHVAEKVLALDMSMYEKAKETDAQSYGHMPPPRLAGLQLRQLAAMLSSDVLSALPFVEIQLDPDNLPEDQELQRALHTAAWLGLVAAMFTGDALPSVLGPICYNLVAWNAAPVVYSPDNWAGRPVALQHFLPARDTEQLNFTYVEFTHLDVRRAWEEYDKLVKRAAAAEEQGVTLKEKWQAASLERALINALEPEWCAKTFPEISKDPLEFHSGVEQFGRRKFYLEHLSLCGRDHATKTRPIPVAEVYYVGLDRTITRYILPHEGPKYQDTPNPRGNTCPVQVVCPPVLPHAPGMGVVQNPGTGLTSPTDWPTLLYKEDLDPESGWVVLGRAGVMQLDQPFQESQGVAGMLVNAHLERIKTIRDFTVRTALSGALFHEGNQAGGGASVRRHGPLLLTNAVLHTNQPVVDARAFQTLINLSDQEIAGILAVLDPSVSDNLSGRPTTAEIHERGAAVQSRRMAFARERAAALSSWLCHAFHSLLYAKYDPHQPGYKSAKMFWHTVNRVLKPYEAALKGTDFKKLLVPFDLRMTFEDASMDVLKQRLSMATDAERPVLSAKMRILAGEDVGRVAWDLIDAGKADNTTEVSLAALESFALKSGAKIPVATSQDHWAHFRTHFMAVQEVLTEVGQNPNADPIDAMTSLMQLGGHMTDHRDLAQTSLVYSAFVEQMDPVLDHLAAAVQELAPKAKAEVQAQAAKAQSSGNSQDVEFAAKLQRQQIAFEQRFAQRQQAAQASARMKDEAHQQKLRHTAEAAALDLTAKAMQYGN